MAKSNAERQADFRARMKAKGFREKLIWVDWENHQAKAKSPTDGEEKPEITLSQLSGQLRKITDGMNKYDAGRLLAELAAHARGLRGRWELNEENMRKVAGSDF